LHPRHTISPNSKKAHAFGSGVKERTASFTQKYRFGFNNQEQETELGEYYSFEYRVHDARLGRFLSVDPLAPEYHWNSTYAFAENSVIQCKDLEGAEKFIATVVPSGDDKHPAPEGFVSIRIRISEAQGIEKQLSECMMNGVQHMISWDEGLTYTYENQYQFEYLKCFLNNTKIQDQCFLVDLRSTAQPPHRSSCGGLIGAKTLSFGQEDESQYYFEWGAVLSMPNNKILKTTPISETIIKNIGEVTAIDFTKEYTTPESADGKALVTLKIGGGDYSNLISFTDNLGNPIPFKVGSNPAVLTSYNAGNESGSSYDDVISFEVDAKTKFNVIISPNADFNNDSWNYDIYINGSEISPDPCSMDKITGY
jgi:RHS repeat-associated protein